MLRLEATPAVDAMASVFAEPAQEPIPAEVAAQVAALLDRAPPGMKDLPGEILVREGRLLLANLGPDRRAIYVFPTTDKQVCFVVTGLSAGCKKAFVVGEPAAISGGTFCFPSASGPPTELAGLTKDGVTGVQVVLDGVPHEAIFGRNAWYFRSPTNHVPATAATELIVTLLDGSGAIVPTRIREPRLPS